jgi:hypothetical protein
MKTRNPRTLTLPVKASVDGENIFTLRRLLRLPLAGGLLTWTCRSALLLLATASGHAQALPPLGNVPGSQAYAPGEVLVQFQATVTDDEINDAFQQAGLGLIKHIQTPAMTHHGQFGITRAATAMPVPVAVRLLNKLAGVEFAEPNWLANQDAISNDPYYSDLLPGPLWGMFGDDTPSPIGPSGTTNPFGSQAEKAWAAGFVGSPDVYVGIIDGGIQVDHPDLEVNIWTNPGEIPGNGVDDDGNGYIDDVHGWNAFDGNGDVSNPNDTESHGSHVAGTIGAVGGNGIGVAGVNWTVTMISGKCLYGPTPYSVIIEAIDYMTDLKTGKGLNIVALNHSWSGTGFSQALFDSIDRAAQAGILSVCAASNAASDNDAAPVYPACLDTTASAGYDAVIAVAAIGRDGNLASYSDFGQLTVDLGAPGGERVDVNNPDLHDPDYEIVSTVPPSSYGYKRGTSMATPHVTGAVALYASVNPGATPAQTRQDLLTAGVRPLEALEGLTLTGGTLDIGTLMELEPIDLLAPGAPANATATVVSGGRVDVSWIDQSNNELGFAIERSADGLNYFVADTVGTSLTGYSDRTVQPGGTYFYRVHAFNPGGASDHAYAPTSVTTPTVTLPNAPSSLTAKALPPGQGVSLAWKDNSTNEDGFQIERKTGSKGSWQLLNTVPANSTKFTDASAARRTTYVYRVRAFNVAGASAFSNEVSVKTK